jgi:hypothetical protein
MTVLPGGTFVDAAQFNFSDAVKVTVGATAAQNATSITVSNLSGAIPSGTVLDFGGTKFAVLTAAAAAGATSLTVRALVTALAANDVATYQGVSGRKPIPSGTLIGRTFAERDAGTGFGPAVVASDDEIYLLALDVVDAVHDNCATLYRRNCLVYEERLPNWASLTTNEKTAIRSRYQCFK